MAEFSLKKILPQSLMGRSLLILILPVLIIQIFTTYQFFERHWDKVTDRLAFALAGEIAIIADRYENAESAESVQYIKEYAADKLDIKVTYAEGASIQKSAYQYVFWERIVVDALSQALRDKVKRPFSVEVSLDDKEVLIDVQLRNGVLEVYAPHRRIFSSSAYTFLLWMVASSILMLAIAILFMRNQIRPIRKLAVAAERFGKGRNVPFLKPSGAREVRRAAESFTKMKERLDRQIQQRTSMLNGVSHDLRTPITRVKLQLAMMGNGDDVKAMQADLDEMENMVNAYLDFARGDGDEDLEWIDVKNFIEKTIQTSWRGAENIHMELEDGKNILLRPIAFSRCINNIVGNAMAYADDVWISTSYQDEKFRLIIEDNGPGVKEELYEELFKPFYRGEASRNKKTGGVGLGLPIAQDIVYSHGGEISLSQSDKGGLKVMIALPL